MAYLCLRAALRTITTLFRQPKPGAGPEQVAILDHDVGIGSRLDLARIFSGTKTLDRSSQWPHQLIQHGVASHIL